MNGPSKKKINIPVIIVIVFFIIFVSLYFIQFTDLYEYEQYNKMIMTKEAMDRFEQDVSEGKNIEIENYLENTVKDYSNNASKLGNKASNFIERLMTDGIKRTFKVLGSLFT